MFVHLYVCTVGLALKWHYDWIMVAAMLDLLPWWPQRLLELCLYDWMTVCLGNNCPITREGVGGGTQAWEYLSVILQKLTQQYLFLFPLAARWSVIRKYTLHPGPWLSHFILLRLVMASPGGCLWLVPCGYSEAHVSQCTWCTSKFPWCVQFVCLIRMCVKTLSV